MIKSKLWILVLTLLLIITISLADGDGDGEEGNESTTTEASEKVTTGGKDGSKAGGDGENDTCGLRRTDVDAKARKKLVGAKGMGRIVGGVDAEPFEFPWQVSIQIYIPKKKKIEHFCGGAVISDQWILTAAHCLDVLKGKEKHLIIKMGSNIMKDPNTPNYSVQKFTLHEEWNRKTQANDIAVIRVNEKITFKTNDNHQYEVNSVCMPEKEFEANGTATLSGFGQTGATASQSDNLQKLDVPIYNHKKCARNYKKYVEINEKKLCAGGKGGQDSCMGDSGGPLVQLNPNENRIQIIGVVSFGYPCAVKDMPGVYTKVSHYIDWIIEKTKEHTV
ncbi:venom peptide isomerase heavy chain-like [Oppia nitens]|uniref:venom peptide isomerase heavy chain-like n=1 Tax=Oppia nitens TaxID=1686743 RepID=UPI0023DB6750|nr:venom peptide isomerase heavy chain-like [Oppia nitens]